MWPKSLTPEIMYGPRKVNSSSLLLFCLILLLVLFRQSNGQDVRASSSSSLPSITSTTARDLTIGLSTVSNSMPTTNSPDSNLGPSSTATTTNTGATLTKSNFLFRPRENHSGLGNGKGTFRQGRSGQDLNSGSYLSAFYGEDSPTFSGGGGGGNNVNVNSPAGTSGKDQAASAGSVGGLSAKDLQQLKRSYQNGQFNEIINSMLKDYEQKIYQIPPAVNSYNHGTGAYGGYTFMGPNSSSGKPPQQGLGPHSASVNHPGDPAGLGTAGYNHQYVQQNYQPSSGYKQYQNPGNELYETIAIPISSQYQQPQQQQKFQNQNYLLPSQSQQTSTASQSQSASSGQHSSSQSQQQPQLPPNQVQSSPSDSGPSTIPFDSIFSQALSPEEISFQFTPIYTAPAPQALMPQFVPFGARFPMLAAMAPPPPPPMPPMQPLFPFPRRNFNTYLNPMIMMNGGAMTGTIPFGPQSFIQPGQASQWNFQNYQMPMFQASATTENFMNPFNLGYFGGSGEYGSPDYGVGTGSSSHQFDLMSSSGTSNNRDSIPSKSTPPENPNNPNNNPNNNNNSKQKISKRLFV